VSVQTGDRAAQNQLGQGILEVSTDGRQFITLGKFVNGKASELIEEQTIRAVRIRPTAAQEQRLAIQHRDLQTDESLGDVSRKPRIVFDSSRAPELADWGVQAQRVAKDSYSMILKALPSKDFIGPNSVRLWFNPDYDGVAATGDDTIEISPKYVAGHKDDFGMVVHELTHAIQHYTQDNDAGWLVEGIADYVRFYLYEPKAPRPKINPEKATYHDAYRTSAAFLAYGQRKYDHLLVRQLNEALRMGTYSDALFKRYTRKEPNQIWDEFMVDLKAGKTKVARL
jgi:hypothetical protein